MSRPLPSGSNELPSKFGGVSALEYICKSRTLVSLRFSIPSASHTHLAFRASRYSPKAYGKSLIECKIVLVHRFQLQETPIHRDNSP